MQLADAEKLALKLMKEFDLLPRWKFAFDNAPRRFGCCHHRRLMQIRHLDGRRDPIEVLSYGTITLSRILVERNDRAEVEDTIRHEIAHALCPRKAGHGPEWKAMCVKTGAKPERCYDEEVDSPKGDWRATCGVCGTEYDHFRRPKGNRYCADSDCKRMMVPYIPGVPSRGFHPARMLTFRNIHEVVEAPSAARRAAIEAMKARMAAAEPGEPDAVSKASKISTERSMMQCVKCNAKNLGSEVCAGCGGKLMPAWLLEKEKEELKRKIKELERKAGK